MALVAFANGARAADSPSAAERLFEEARGDMKRGDFVAARGKLIESLHAEATVGALFNLGLCEEKLGLVRNSLEHLRAALAQTGEDDRRRPIMTALIASLETRASRVILKGTPKDSIELQVTLDGVLVEASPDGHEVLVDPGEHELVLRGRGGSRRATVIHVAEGATVVQTVDEGTTDARTAIGAREPSTDPRAAPTGASVVAASGPAGDGRIRQRLGAVAVNAGGAALIAGAVFGFKTIGSKISVDHHCDATGCDDEGRRASAAGATYSTASTALTVAGLASLGVGSYLLLGSGAAPGDRATPRERTVGTIAGSVGAAALVAGAIAEGVALSAKRDLEGCLAGPCTDPEGLNASARNQTATTVATVALAVGVTGLAVASYSLLLRPRFAPTTNVHLTLSPSAITLATAF